MLSRLAKLSQKWGKLFSDKIDPFSWTTVCYKIINTDMNEINKRRKYKEVKGSDLEENKLQALNFRVEEKLIQQYAHMLYFYIRYIGFKFYIKIKEIYMCSLNCFHLPDSGTLDTDSCIYKRWTFFLPLASISSSFIVYCRLVIFLFLHHFRFPLLVMHCTSASHTFSQACSHPFFWSVSDTLDVFLQYI